MLQSLLDKITKPAKVIGLSLHIGRDGTKAYSLCVLERRGSEVKVITQEGGLADLSEAKTVLKPQWPVALSLSGKGVLTKEIQSKSDQAETLLAEALPNVEPSDFCFEQLPVTTGSLLLLTKREQLDQQLAVIQAKGFQVIQVALGVGAVRYLLPLLDKPQQDYSYGHQQLRVENQQLQQVVALPEEQAADLLLGSECLPAELVPAFSIALGTLMGGTTDGLYPAGYLTNSRQQFTYQRLFQVSGWGMLGTLLVVMLINFMVFSWLEKHNNQQSLNLSDHQTQLEQVKNLRQNLQEKQSFFKSNNILQASKTAYYADAIASEIPEGIVLTSLQIFPPIAANKREPVRSYQALLIRLSGASQRSSLLNDWIKTMQAKAWVKEVKVLPYAEQRDGTGVFELEVYL